MTLLYVDSSLSLFMRIESNEVRFALVISSVIIGSHSLSTVR